MRETLLCLLAEAAGDAILAVDAQRLTAAEIRAAAEPPAASGGGIAVIPLQGPLTPRGMSFFGRQLTPGMNDFRAALQRAVADPNVGAIVLDVNSPGGTYAGTPETANAVRAANAQKPVVAVVDSLCASAAYFIASQAGAIAVTPSGEVGSIGVLAVHQEFSKMLDEAGINVSIIRSRSSKADTNPFEPLTDEARAALQASVDEADADFLKTVAAGRNMTLAQVRDLADNQGAGRLLSAKAAVKAGLADKVATMGEVLAGMVKAPKAAAQRRRSSLVFD